MLTKVVLIMDIFPSFISLYFILHALLEEVLIFKPSPWWNWFCQKRCWCSHFDCSILKPPTSPLLLIPGDDLLQQQLPPWLRAARPPCWMEPRRRRATYAAAPWPVKSCWCPSWCCWLEPSWLGTWWPWLWFSALNTSTHHRDTWRPHWLSLTWLWGCSWCRCPSTRRFTSWRPTLLRSGPHTTRSLWVSTLATLLDPSLPGAP